MTAARADRLVLIDAEEGDLAWILNLEEEAARGGFVSGDTMMRHRQQMNDPTCLYLIAKRGDDPVGYVILRGVSGGAPVIELKRIVVHQRDAGHGQSVLAHLLHKLFVEMKAHRVWLDVIDTNDRAMHVYRKLGFVEEGRLRSAVMRKGEWRDLVVFGLLESEHRAQQAGS
jgi:diamine N-acetyltransferase